MLLVIVVSPPSMRCFISGGIVPWRPELDAIVMSSWMPVMWAEDYEVVEAMSRLPMKVECILWIHLACACLG